MPMENLFLDLGLSWTLAKATPYCLAILIGIAPLIFLKRIKRIIRLVFIPLPFFIYFAFFPIYQGDFTNNLRSVQNSEGSFIEEGKLTVLTIPGCPYCYECLDDLAILGARNPEHRISFLVVTTDDSNLDWYRSKASKQVEVKKIDPNDPLINKITRGSYPTFLFKKNNQITVWSNSGFGVRAKDWIEEQMQ
jgi:hypothetical protein